MHVKPGQTIATFQRNISQHSWRYMLCKFEHSVRCDVLQRVGCCWLKFENGQIFHATIVDVE